MQLLNGEYVIIEQVQHELLERPVTVYNFEVEDFHTYYVGEGSILVHNMCAKLKQPKDFFGKPQSAKSVISYLKDNGFEVVSQKGSHVKLFDVINTVIVPDHGSKEIAIGTLKSILKQSGLG